MFITIYNYTTEDHPERAIHVTKADKICAMHKNVVRASCVDYSVTPDLVNLFKLKSHVIHVHACTHVPYAYIYLLHTLITSVGSIIYALYRARTGFMQVNKTRTTFGNPDQIWQPKVVGGRTNFGSEKWSARTNFRVTTPPPPPPPPGLAATKLAIRPECM